jgi:hypothetical protein
MRNPENPRMKPTDRSSSPHTRRNTSPIAMIAHGASVQVMFAMLSWVRNVDEAEEKNPK